jgi:RND family efflux transporter MFP subunit
MRTIHESSTAVLRPGFFLLTLVAAGTALGLSAGCHHRPTTSSAKESSKEEEATSTPTRPKVSVVHPQRKTVRRSIKRPGFNIESYQCTPLFAKISGYVGKWNLSRRGKPFDIGDTVQPDEVLAELFVPEMEVEVQQKEALVAQAEAEIKQARAAVLRANADRDYRKSQYDRLSRVGQRGVIDRENVEEARFALEAAKAVVAKDEADVAVAEKRLGVAEKARDYAKTMLEYKKIRAPFKGVITKRYINERDFIQAATGNKGNPLFVVEQTDPVRVFVNVPEVEAVQVREQDEAIVRTLRGQVFKGTVTRTALALDPATRTLRTEIDLPNPEGKLSPGTYVDVTITPERKNVWTLPESAVVTTEEGSHCYRLEDGKAVRTLLQIGLRGSGLLEVQKKQSKPAKGSSTEEEWEDFTGDEKIINSGVAELKDGQAVEESADGGKGG